MSADAQLDSDALAVRPAGLPDVDAVVALVESAYRGEASNAGWTTEADLLAGQRTDADEVVDAVTDPHGVLLVAGPPGSLLGCARVQRRGEVAGEGEVAYVGMVAVAPGQQGAGLGRALLAAAEQQATAWGIRRAEMTVIEQRAELIAWYERRGWSRTGEVRPFPYGDERFGLPRRDDLRFVVLDRALP